MALLKKSTAAPAKAGGVTKKIGAKPAAPVSKSVVKAPSKIGSIGAKKAKDASTDDGDGAVVTSGWGGADKMRAEMSGFTTPLKLADGETVVIRFLDDEPYANVATHWLERKGKKSFICLGNGCPLCGIGDRPRATYNFNVVKLGEGDPTLYSWEVGVKLLKQIETANKAKTGPLTRRYYSLTRSGSTKDNTSYTLAVIRRVDDIEDDFPGVYVPGDDELAAVKGYTKEDILKQRSSLKEMREVAAGIAKEFDSDEDDD